MMICAAVALPMVAAVVLLNSCSTAPHSVVSPVEIPGATYVGNQACYYCHTNYSDAFAMSPHARVRFRPAANRNDHGCELCHGPGSLHAESGRRDHIVNPGKDATACFQCHLTTHAEFQMPHHHPVIEGKMNCVQCHDPHGFDIMKPARGLAMARVNESCAQCHREQARPFIFEHEAMRESCMACHTPHGSVNDKMLTQSDANLCLRCHAQNPGASPGEIYIGKVRHTAFLRQGTCWAAGCHTAVHGSNVNPRMFY